MRNTLAVQVGDTSQDLLEAALDLGRGHAPALDGSIEVAAGTELHDFAPVLVLVLHKVDRLHNVDVVQRRRYAELRRELLDVLLLRLVLSSLTELLQAEGGLNGRSG